MKKKLFKLFVVGVFVFVGFGIRVDALSTSYNDYLNDNNLNLLEVLNTQATLKVSGIYSSESFKAYKILDVYYNSSTNEMLYGFTEPFYNFLYENELFDTFTIDDYFALTSGDITSGSTITTSELDALMSQYASYIKTNSILGLDMTVSSDVASLMADAGSYLVLPTQTQRVFAVMVGNLDMYADGTEWKVNDETIVAKVSDVYFELRYTDLYGNLISSSIIGREYITEIYVRGPTYPTNATNKKFVITDTLSSGITFGGLSTIALSYNSDTVYLEADDTGIIKDGDGNVVATSTFSDQILTIDFDKNYISSDFTVSYITKLNEHAGVGYNVNTDSVVLTYSNEPYGLGTTTYSNSTSIETWGLQIYKYDVEDTSPLEGAVFEVYADEGLTDLIGTITTGSDGIGRFKGIAYGTAYLKEKKAPTGYRLLSDSIEVSLIEETSLEDVEIEVPSGYVMQYIANEKMGLLPVTGGVGTVIFTIVGLMVIVGSISFITIYNTKKNKENFQV